MRKFFLISLLAMLAVTGVAYFKYAKKPTPPPHLPTMEARPPFGWQLVAPHLVRETYLPPNARNVTITLYRLDHGYFTFRFQNALLPKSVSVWLNRNPNAVLVANGVYFNEDFSPSGLLIANDNRLGAKMFDLNRTALLELAPAFHIIDTKHEHVDLKNMLDAGQSYPLLIEGGKAVVEKSNTYVARRTFIGSDRDGNEYVGIVSPNPVTLHDLANYLAAMDVGWDRVLNLDGGPSSGIAVRSKNGGDTIDSIVAVPNVIVVEER